MHKAHLACLFGIVIALVLVVATGGSAGSFGLLAGALVCPLAMGAAMWLLMRGGHAVTDDRPAAPDREHA